MKKLIKNCIILITLIIAFLWIILNGINLHKKYKRHWYEKGQYDLFNYSKAYMNHHDDDSLEREIERGRDSIYNEKGKQFFYIK